MRILYHHRTFGDGAEGIHIQAMVTAFTRLGHDVYVAALPASRLNDTPTVAERVKRHLPRVLSELLATGLNAHEYAVLRRAIRSFRPDILYKRHARFDVASVLAARHTGVPSILEVNCVFSNQNYAQFEPPAIAGLARSFELTALTEASVVLAVSTPLARQIAEACGVQAVVLPNGVDPERFDPARACGERVRSKYALETEFVVGWTGILREWHGLELLLHALEAVPDAALLVVGDGPARESFERIVASRSLSGRVRVTGRVAHEQIPDHLAAMDVCVVADDRTGVASPMKMLEYMAMGRPVVAPGLDSIRDVLQPGVNGVIFEARDAADLARVLRMLEGDAALRRALGQRAREMVVRDRTWTAVAQAALSCVEHHRGAVS